MRILAIIPARGGSKGVPKKNIKLLGKKPLIEYTIDDAKKTKLLSQIIVSTDDEEIVTAAEIAGCKPPFMRPKELAKDDSTSLEVAQHAITFFESKNIFFDAVCLLPVYYTHLTLPTNREVVYSVSSASVKKH